eukprot:CAMPEP_0172512874 /NCGR_PEP_ID=MMETSP1066-20121228/247799_1 /TAXON_ID=671091 /ORGANISM="Coscinodiscus wailesii, Strain CCMP2513" /LENGTH=228 /DNA_ID=CAMNT_0013292859 /DNA_START=120 /DNA_END=807 /DNA_ORIENTATION=-
MTTNIFTFGNTHWHQLDGTAMGTNTASNYAILYVGYHEQKNLLPKWNSTLKCWKRYVDDANAALPNDHHLDSRIAEIKADLESFGTLEWTVTKSSHTVNFLNVTLIIDPITGRLEYKPFPKKLNLYTYPPAHSAHSPGVVKSIINGVLRTTFLLSSKIEFYMHEAKCYSADSPPKDILPHYYVNSSLRPEENSINLNMPGSYIILYKANISPYFENLLPPPTHRKQTM